MRLTAILLALATVTVASPTKRDPQCVCPTIPDSVGVIDDFSRRYEGPSTFTCRYVGVNEGLCTYFKVCPTLYLSFLKCPNGRHVREAERLLHLRNRTGSLGTPLPAKGEPESV
jgi:hypothetical protein